MEGKHRVIFFQGPVDASAWKQNEKYVDDSDDSWRLTLRAGPWKWVEIKEAEEAVKKLQTELELLRNENQDQKKEIEDLKIKLCERHAAWLEQKKCKEEVCERCVGLVKMLNKHPLPADSKIR